MIVLSPTSGRCILRRGRILVWIYNGLLIAVLLSFCLLLHMSTFNGKLLGGGGISTSNIGIVVKSTSEAKQHQPTKESENITASDIIIRSMIPPELHKYLANSSNATEFRQFSNGTKSNETKNLDIAEIKKRIKEHNEEQKVLNYEKFGPLKNDSLVIVIQVHTRLMYLRHLIISMAQAEGIQNALLVFSHDFYDEEINSLVDKIDFCKVIQIFYPYSIQTHPNEFPGESPNDCPRDIDRAKAVKQKCNNAMYPDLYGHYREAKFTQTKHHWWWKANQVFNGLNITKDHNGLVLFLEEDHYVAPDFIYMLKQLELQQKLKCRLCRILSLGTYARTVNFPLHSNKGEITLWISSKHNMGMAFNISVWNEFLRCADKFCHYDDYNWDWSLQYISNTCLSRELTALMLTTPRVYHIGECGVHHKSSCKSTAALRKIQKLLTHNRQFLYPKHFYIGSLSVKKKELRKGNGGWGDIRDVNLCLNMTLQTR